MGGGRTSPISSASGRARRSGVHTEAAVSSQRSMSVTAKRDLLRPPLAYVVMEGHRRGGEVEAGPHHLPR